MKLEAILKSINVKNTDVESFLTIKLEVNNYGIDLTALNNLKHKALLVDIKESEQ